MDRRIDLTEHNDFSVTHWGLMDTDITSIRGLIQADLLSTKDYYRVSRYVDIFGLYIHYSQANEIFAKDEFEYINEMKSHCHRCGKEFRIPWNHTDLCDKCNTEMDDEYHSRIPWKEELKYSSSFTRRNDPKEIFRLR